MVDDERARVQAYQARYAVLNELRRREALERPLDQRVRMMDQAFEFAVSQGWTGEKPFDLQQNALWLKLKRMDGGRPGTGR
ncbi:MAG: hypothetical protein KIS66_04850 [Fimbriimonadaceae bacterium]|nr:hypothetical protein [Fimbriimonadaceae bacterium]